MATATERRQRAVAGWDVSVAGPGDLTAVRSLLAEGPDIPGREAEVTAAVAEGRCLVARHRPSESDVTMGAAGPVVGLATHDRSLFGRPFLSLLLVAAAARRGGAGSALVLGVVDRTEGDRLFTSTNSSNEPMRMLVGRLGFVSCGYVEHLDDGDPELVYVRWLRGAGPAAIPAPVEAPD